MERVVVVSTGEVLGVMVVTVATEEVEVDLVVAGTDLVEDSVVVDLVD